MLITVYTYKRYHDKGFLLWIFYSSIFNFILLITLTAIFGHYASYFTSLFIGLITGYYNVNIKRGLFCGATGIYIS